MVVGSWTEFIVGGGNLLALVLGFLAWHQARRATHWAEQATHWAKVSAELQDAALPVRFNARMHHQEHHTGDEPGPQLRAWLEITVKGSTPVILHEVETLPGAQFGSGGQIDLDDLGREQPVNAAFDHKLPRRLLPGQTMVFNNPWSSYSPRPGPNASARLQLFFSVTSESPKRGTQIDVQIGDADCNT